jgi:cytochrome c peroxidase
MRIPALILAGAVLALAARDTTVDRTLLKRFAPLPSDVPSASNPFTDTKIDLGRRLYYEPRLSKNQKLACNSCHLLDRFGVDNQPTSAGFKNQKGDRNSPTVYNAAGHVAQFWDGRAATVEEQAKGPVMNPVEMAMPSKEYVLQVLKSIPQYEQDFRKAFPGQSDPITYDNMALAIGAFERKLVTPSRWDKFLAGDDNALTSAEKTGFEKFVETGCAGCHGGAYVGGAMYSKLGIAKPWPNQKDLGRFNVTKKESDKLVFKAPSLRNIEKTGPYFHDGSVATLDKAIELMAEYENGKKLGPADVQSIATFLKALTGTVPADYIKPPKMYPSSPKTPKAETGD